MFLSESEVAQLFPTLCNPMDCSLPGSSIHGIFQAIVLEWGAIAFSRGSSWPRDRTWVSLIVDRSHQGSFLKTLSNMTWSYLIVSIIHLQSEIFVDSLDGVLFQLLSIQWHFLAFNYIALGCSLSLFLIQYAFLRLKRRHKWRSHPSEKKFKLI